MESQLRENFPDWISDDSDALTWEALNDGEAMQLIREDLIKKEKYYHWDQKKTRDLFLLARKFEKGKRISWKKVANYMKDVTGIQAKTRYYYLKKSRRPGVTEEDEIRSTQYYSRYK